MHCDFVTYTDLCPELEKTDQTTIPHAFFDVIGFAEIQAVSGYGGVRFQESDKILTCLTVERKLFEGV